MQGPRDGQTWFDWHRDDLPGFIDAGPDLGLVHVDASAIYVDGGVKHPERLARLNGLRRLSLRNVKQAMLDSVADLPHLEELRVFGFSGTDLSPLAGLASLRILSFEWAPKVESWNPLASLTGLSLLILGDFARVLDASPLSPLTNLSALSVHGSASATQRLHSIAPLAALTGLVDLNLEVRAADDDLEPLAALKRLRWLWIANLYQPEAFARLAKALPTTSCAAFSPVQRYQINNEEYLMLTGRPVRHFKADDPRAAVHVARRSARFEAALAAGLS